MWFSNPACVVLCTRTLPALTRKLSALFYSTRTQKTGAWNGCSTALAPSDWRVREQELYSIAFLILTHSYMTHALINT